VGKADNKNPKGQRPDASDHNNGYECDGNNGIAKGNPAHTACPPPVECVPGDEECSNPPCVEGDEECPPCVQGDEECSNPPCVEGDEICPDDTTPPGGTELNRPPIVLGTETVRAPHATAAVARPAAALPNTGASDMLSLFAAVGSGLVLVGGLTLVMRRRGQQV
jgi:LPXTG-motif cell wall-anchored protein